MVRFFKGLFIREYNTRDRILVEDFRKQSFSEGNESLSFSKYNPDNIDGQTQLAFINSELVSLSVCEASHYTGDPDIAARICRYHILKKYRHCNAGFQMLPHHVEWAKNNGFKIIYWTCDIKNKPLNAIYQRKKQMIGKKKFSEDDLYISFQLKKEFLFKVSPKSDFLQYIYSKTLEEGYIWTPKKNIVFHMR